MRTFIVLMAMINATFSFDAFNWQSLYSRRNSLFMKEIVVSFLLVIFFINAHSQNFRDTLYDSRINNENNLQVIFIDTPNSNFHQLVFQFLLSGFNSNQNNLKEHSNKNAFRNHSSISRITGDWISIYTYRGKPYAYYPSEPFFNLFIRITDSTIVINDFNDGFITYFISKTIYRKRKFILYVVDASNKKHRLLFQTNNNTFYKLESSLLNKNFINMVKKETYFELPIIVNHCPGNRCQEFNFK